MDLTLLVKCLCIFHEEHWGTKREEVAGKRRDVACDTGNSFTWRDIAASIRVTVEREAKREAK